MVRNQFISKTLKETRSGDRTKNCNGANIAISYKLMYSWYSCSILLSLKQKGGNLVKSDRRGGGRRYEWVERGVEREDLGGRKKKCHAWEGSGKG